MISPGAIVLLFPEDFARENKSLRKGMKYFEWQKRYDARDIAYAIVGITLADLVREGYIELNIKKGFFGKKVVFTRRRAIPKDYGVVIRGLNSIEIYKETELRSALFLSFPVSRFPAAALGVYIIQKELKGEDVKKLREDPEIKRRKDELKLIFESFKQQNEELWKRIVKEIDKAFDLVKGKEGHVLYTPLDMLEG